jgi:hypothetical protein
MAAQPVEIPESNKRVSKPDGVATENPINNTAETMKEMDRSANNHLFPIHLLIIFDVYKGANIFRIGEARHQFDIIKDRYQLKAVTQLAGFSSLNNDDQISQVSQGKIDTEGLRPDVFIEERFTNGHKKSLKVVFDRSAQKMYFSRGDDAVLTADTQDKLSFMYQLSQLSMRREIISLPVSDGTQLNSYQIEIGGSEDIVTPIGKLRALHLSQMHPQNEPYFEIWLAMEYRLLPIKFRQIDSAGDVAEEWVITDIRANDE